MTPEEAIAFVALARKSGFAFCCDNRAKLDEALKIKRDHLIATDPSYAKGYNKLYQRLCIQTGRIDLLNKK